MSHSAPRPCRAVLFDKDGTLVDFRGTWLPRYRGAAAEIAARAGRPVTLAATLLERLGYDAGADRFAADSPLLWDTNDAVAARWAAMPEVTGRVDAREVAERHFADHDRYPPVGVGDLPALLTRLRGAGLALGVATMDDTANAHDTAARLGIAHLLDFVAGADAGHGAKPGPGMALAFCAARGLDPAEVAVVGDTRADLMMARAAGCGLAVAVLTGGTPRQAVEDLADHVLEDVHGLPGLLSAA